MSVEVVRHVRPGSGPGTLLEITPASVGWRYLSFQVVALAPGETIEGETGGSEFALVALGGSGWFDFDGQTHSGEGRVPLHDVAGDQVSVEDATEESPHIPGAVPPTRPHQRFTPAYAAMRVVGIGMHKPAMREKSVVPGVGGFVIGLVFRPIGSRAVPAIRS